MDYRLLFCDVDGTLTETLSGKPFKQNPTDIKIISGAELAIAKFRADGWIIVGVSNQGGIAKGHKTLNDTVAEMRHTLVLFPEIASICFCPDFEGKECYAVNRRGYEELGQDFPGLIGTYRKPGSGMLHLAKGVLEVVGEKISGVAMVGDRPEDAAAAAGIGALYYEADFWRKGYGNAKSTAENLT
ncbi:MAG: polynucleotide kinase [Hassallia sp. WJT32-NPBG1]|jgi:D-glycero-D-manno-heptose 1,7-bisphosphate phosphatase|nr:polynucleotide kinase [Hassallia sp. WJT32-NPBG1]